MVTGFMAGVALGQQLVGMTKSKKRRPTSAAQRLQSAKWAAYKRMQARQAAINFAKNQQQARLTNNTQSGSPTPDSTEKIVFEEGFNNEFRKAFKDDTSGQLLNSIRNTFREFNAWVKEKTGGLLDLNMSLAIVFIIRGVRRIVLEKQYPNAWQMIWWASSILRGWRFV